jgi:hypothetical protein
MEPVTAKKNRTSESAITKSSTGSTATLPSTLDHNDAITTSSDNPAPEEMSSWNCRLPSKLMSLVLEQLTEDQALGTLAEVQSTSRAVYTLATPYLYRHIIINQQQALKLFGLFDTFPRDDNSVFLEAVPTDQHSIDTQLPHRLRSFFSYTTTLLFRLAYCPVSNNDEDEDYNLDRYAEVVKALATLNQPPLWPVIRQCDLDMDAMSYHDITLHSTPRFHSSDVPSLVEALFTNMHPNRLSIVLPTPPRGEFWYSDHDLWEEMFCRLKADHVEIVNLSGWSADEVPRGGSSLTLKFMKPRPKIDDQLTTLETCYSLFNGYRPHLRLEHLKLIGMPSSRDGAFLDLAEIVAHVFSTIRPYMLRVMQIRQEDGNMDDLKVTIQPDSSPEGVLAAVSRIYKQSIPV